MTSHVIYDNDILKSALGTHYETQLAALQKADELFQNLDFSGKEKLFVGGFLITIRSSIGVHEYMRDTYGHPHLKTQNLNQDHVERTFGVLRDQGGSDRHPPALHMLYRVQKMTTGILMDVSYLQKQSTKQKYLNFRAKNQHYNLCV